MRALDHAFAPDDTSGKWSSWEQAAAGIRDVTGDRHNPTTTVANSSAQTLPPSVGDGRESAPSFFDGESVNVGAGGPRSYQMSPADSSEVAEAFGWKQLQACFESSSGVERKNYFPPLPYFFSSPRSPCSEPAHSVLSPAMPPVTSPPF
jgi:hypothetical protein